MNTNKFFHDWSSEVYTDRNNIVFEGKNQQYGAYQIRKEYNNVVFLSFTFAILGLLLVSGIPYVISYLKSQYGEVPIPTLDPPIIISCGGGLLPREMVKPVIPKGVVKPTISTVKDIAPKVVDNIKPDDDNYRSNNELTNKEGGLETVEGDGKVHENLIIEEKPVIPDDEESGNEIRSIVQEMPSFIGGQEELLKYIYKNVHYPETEKEIGITGTVYVYFVINKLGNVEDAKIIRGVKGGFGLEKEALHVILNMPTWKPGIQNGKPVKVQFTFPISFSLN